MRWVLITGLLLVVPVQAGNPGGASPEDLIHAMRADEQAARLIERSVRDDCRYQKCKVDLTKCLMTIDREDLMSSLVSLAKRELTPAEIEAGTTYFRSDIGARHLEFMWATRETGKTYLNDQESTVRAAMLAFLDTPAGYRLVTRSLLTNSTEFNRMVRLKSRLVFYECQPSE